MNISLENFGNERYTILKILYINRTKVKNNYYTPLSQQEIADIAHYSKLKTNRIINELKKMDCVLPYQNKKGKYMVTNTGEKVLQLMQVSIRR